MQLATLLGEVFLTGTLRKISVLFLIILLNLTFIRMRIPTTLSMAKPETVDLFQGNFTPSNIVRPLTHRAVDIMFSITPRLPLQNATIRILLPSHLVELVEGNLTWRGDVDKHENVQLTFTIKVHKEIKANIGAYVEAYVSGRKTIESFYLPIVTDERKSHISPTYATDTSSRHASSQLEVFSSYRTASSPGFITVVGRFMYVNEWGNLSPMRHVKVELYDEEAGLPDWPDPQALAIAMTYTDANGYYAFENVNNYDGASEGGLDIARAIPVSIPSWWAT